MNTYYIKRTARSVLTLWVVVTLTFGLIRQLPGSPYSQLRTTLARQGMPESTINSIIARKKGYDPNATLAEQYQQYMGGLLQGDLGESINYRPGESVASVVADALPWTILVMTTATILMFAIATVLGAALAYKEGTRFDTVSSGVAIITSTLPFYVLAILLVKWFGYGTEWFPKRNRYNSDVYDTTSLEPGFLLNAIHHAILPIVSVLITQIGLHALAMRGNSIQVLGEDYVRVARLRGLSDRRISTRYVARNAMLPMYTAFLTVIGFNLSGSVVLEVVFTYRGMGWVMIETLNSKDYPVLMGIFLVISTALVLSVFIADLTYGLIDPRINTGEQSESY